MQRLAVMSLPPLGEGAFESRRKTNGVTDEWNHDLKAWFQLPWLEFCEANLQGKFCWFWSFQVCKTKTEKVINVKMLKTHIFFSQKSTKSWNKCNIYDRRLLMSFDCLRWVNVRPLTKWNNDRSRSARNKTNNERSLHPGICVNVRRTNPDRKRSQELDHRHPLLLSNHQECAVKVPLQRWAKC